MLADLFGKALLHMILGMSFVFMFLGVLVGYMHLLARDWRPAAAPYGSSKNGDAEESREREAEKETLAVMALSEYETGAELDPGVAAAIGMALFQVLEERRAAAADARSGPAAGLWAQDGRERMMSQRAMWWWRDRS
jgi:Na+-transporting methylmalonyl-CoA/oxaloacetate decarboxylase gamma subunit